MQNTFTAAMLRDGQKEPRLIPNCVTDGGHLCTPERGKLTPFWNAVALEADGISREVAKQYPTVQAARAGGMEKYLLKFGKQEGYWIWNHEAAERKKLVEGKTVYLYEKKQADWDDDEPELRMADKPYPKEVWEAIRPHVSGNGKWGYEVTSHSGLKAALKNIGWKTNK